MSIDCEFVGLGSTNKIPDRVSILRLRHLLEANGLSRRILQIINDKLSAQGLMLKSGTVVDATLISAPSSTKNKDGERDPGMHQAKKGKQWHFGKKAHIGVDAESGLVHTVIGTAANVNVVRLGLKDLFLYLLFMHILGRFMAKFIHPNTPTIAENQFEIPYPLAIRA